MANSTDPFAQSVHGTDPQYLVEKITRLKVYNCDYWKSECFGLTSETIIDKAVALKYCGGTYGGNVKPTDFLALTLKMLQLQPEKDIVIAFIQNENFKYLRLLGALYMRLVGKPVDIYKYLEPLYNDYRKVAYRGSSGWSIKYIDQFIDSLLNDELVCDIALPHLPKRMKLEDLGILLPRKSALDIDINAYLLETQARAVEIKVLEGKNDNVAISFNDDEDEDDKNPLDDSENLNKILQVKVNEFVIMSITETEIIIIVAIYTVVEIKMIGMPGIITSTIVIRRLEAKTTIAAVAIVVVVVVVIVTKPTIAVVAIAIAEIEILVVLVIEVIAVMETLIAAVSTTEFERKMIAFVVAVQVETKTIVVQTESIEIAVLTEIIVIVVWIAEAEIRAATITLMLMVDIDIEIEMNVIKVVVVAENESSDRDT